MAKTKEELKQLKQEVSDIASKLSELSEEELEQIASGGDLDLSGIEDFFKKIGKGIRSITKPVIK